VYLQRHVANLRLGMTLELFSALGALVGGLVPLVNVEVYLVGVAVAIPGASVLPLVMFLRG